MSCNVLLLWLLLAAGGGGSLVAKSSSYQDNCCLVISSYTAPSMNATQLLLFTDPDTSRSTPPGYMWPYDGSEAGAAGGRAGQRSGLSHASLTGLIVGLCAAAVLAAVLVGLLVTRHRRRKAADLRQQSGSIYKPQSFTGDSGSNSTYSSRDRCYGGSGPHGRAADVAAVGSAYNADQQGSLQTPSLVTSSGSGTGMGLNSSGEKSDGASSNIVGNKRWQKLTNAISGKVQDIHQQRLRTAFMQSVTSGAAAGRGSGAAAAAAAAGAGESSASLPYNSTSNASTPVQGSGNAGVFAGDQQEQQHRGEGDASSGDTLDLKELIGRGTFGTVYRWACWVGLSCSCCGESP